ncbi:unnamed protein product (mitochondrion) [Plasmodiophora brassicae]|uniref:EF-hand domain-containing protein n=1 Tax=Plasmodiophora brassicae TaxID=37360 RepID=A0A0G4IM25_PLABS|nr:hypothetical protein PBRA_004977 [Plasmodiophora brassicae]SPQ99244.1 unnamed protein product [Plasmodiophora brassicae]
MRARFWKKKRLQREGFRCNFLSASLPRMYDLDERTLEKIWAEYDPKGTGRLTGDGFDRFVHDCAETLINIMRPIFARRLISKSPTMTPDECNLEFDRKYSVTDISGSDPIRQVIRSALISAVSPRDPDAIEQSELIDNWPSFADLFRMVQSGKLDTCDVSSIGICE